jgi:hypothetical protein
LLHKKEKTYTSPTHFLAHAHTHFHVTQTVTHIHTLADVFEEVELQETLKKKEVTQNTTSYDKKSIIRVKMSMTQQSESEKGE